MIDRAQTGGARRNSLVRTCPSNRNAAPSHRMGPRANSSSVQVRGAKISGPGRPSLDDVDRISRGQAAKRRGVGSRAVPHRLNSDERVAYDAAKKKGFLVLKGWGWRKERKGSPLRNIFRQYCDARNVVCVTILQAPDGADTVEVDTSTLRLCGVEEAQIREEIARTMGTVAVDSDSDEAANEKELPEEAIQVLPIWQIDPKVLVYEASDRNEAYELVKTLSTDLKLARSVGSVSKQHPVRDKKRQHRDQRQYEARDFRTDDVP